MSALRRVVAGLSGLVAMPEDTSGDPGEATEAHLVRDQT